jgi:hypothetical protein
MEYYSAIKNKIRLFAEEWMEPEITMLSKKQKLRKTGIMFSFM